MSGFQKNAAGQYHGPSLPEQGSGRCPCAAAPVRLPLPRCRSAASHLPEDSVMSKGMDKKKEVKKKPAKTVKEKKEAKAVKKAKQDR
jgi:hypothetical protein